MLSTWRAPKDGVPIVAAKQIAAAVQNTARSRLVSAMFAARDAPSSPPPQPISLDAEITRPKSSSGTIRCRSSAAVTLKGGEQCAESEGNGSDEDGKGFELRECDAQIATRREGRR